MTLPSSWLIYALLSALFAGLTTILAKVGVSGVDSNLATAIRTIVILLFAWGIVLAQGTTPQLSHLSRTTWLFLILSGVATGLSWLFYFRALQIGRAVQVAPIDKLSLVLAVIMAVIFLKEKLTVSNAVGASLIALGALVMAIWQ